MLHLYEVKEGIKNKLTINKISPAYIIASIKVYDSQENYNLMNCIVLSIILNYLIYIIKVYKAISYTISRKENRTFPKLNNANLLV